MDKMSPGFVELIFYVIKSIKALLTNEHNKQVFVAVLLYYPFGGTWKETGRVFTVRGGNVDRDGSMGEGITCTKVQGRRFAEDGLRDNRWGVREASAHG